MVVYTTHIFVKQHGIDPQDASLRGRLPGYFSLPGHSLVLIRGMCVYVCDLTSLCLSFLIYEILLFSRWVLALSNAQHYLRG